MAEDPRLDGTRATYDRIADEYAAGSGEADLTPEFVARRSGLPVIRRWAMLTARAS